MTVSINGAITENAEISVFDSSCYFGFAIYETISITSGIPLFIDEHLNRLLKAATYLHFKLSKDFKNIAKKRIHQMIALTSIEKTYRLRLLISPATLKFPQIDFNDTTMIISIAEAMTTTAKSYKFLLSRYLKQDSPEIPSYIKKTANIQNLLSAREANQYQCDEALLMTNSGRITEGSFSNIFFIRDDIVITAADDSDILQGITRNKVLEICKKQDITVELQCLPISELHTIDTCFLTSSTRALAPIEAILADTKFFRVHNPLLYKEIHKSFIDSDTIKFTEKHAILSILSEQYIEFKNQYLQEYVNDWS